MLNTKAAARIDLLQLEQWMLVRLTECFVSKQLGEEVKQVAQECNL